MRKIFLTVSLLTLVFFISVISAVRMPVVGGDSDAWGQVLNDYLNTTINDSGQLRIDVVGLWYNSTASMIANTTFLQNFTLANIQSFLNNTDNYFSSLGIGSSAPTATLEINSSNTNGALYVHNISAAKESYLFVNGSNGNVGINTTTPTRALYVKGDIQSSASVIANNYYLSDGVSLMSQIGSSNILFKVNGSEALRIINGGNVGIGTASPTATLEINSSNTNGTLYIHNNTASKDPYLFVNGSNGFVGIGTTNPNQLLTVNGTINATSGDIWWQGTNVSANLATTANIGTNYNSTASLIANKTFLQNFTTASIGSFYNTTSNIIFNTTFLQNFTTANIGSFYNATAGTIANLTFKQNFTTATIQSFVNSTSLNLVTLGLNLTSAATSILDIDFGNITNDIASRGILTEYYNSSLYLKGNIIKVANGSRALPQNATLNSTVAISAIPLFYDGLIWRVGSLIDTRVVESLPNITIGSELRFFTGNVTGNATNGTITGLTQRMVIDENGNVGIGTPIPTQALHVVGIGNFTRDLWSNGVNVSANLGTTANIGTNYNFTAGLIANLTFYQNFTTATIGSFYNTTSNIIFNTTFLQNFTTASIGSFYNATASIIANLSFLQNFTIKAVQGLVNNTAAIYSSLGVGTGMVSNATGVLIANNITATQIIGLTVYTTGALPVCGTDPGFNGTIMRNSSGVYGCQSNASWKLIF